MKLSISVTLTNDGSVKSFVRTDTEQDDELLSTEIGLYGRLLVDAVVATASSPRDALAAAVLDLACDQRDGTESDDVCDEAWGALMEAARNYLASGEPATASDGKKETIERDVITIERDVIVAEETNGHVHFKEEDDGDGELR